MITIIIITIPTGNVTLTKDFYIGMYPVTQAQWHMVMGTNPSSFKGFGEFNRPVEMVSWTDIVGDSGGTMEINGIPYRENGFIFKLYEATGKIFYERLSWHSIGDLYAVTQDFIYKWIG